MARHKNPALAILTYFREAPIEAAEQLLALARAEVAARQPTKAIRRRGVAKAASPKFAVRDEQGNEVAVALATEPLSKPPRRRKPQDVALPGIQGPGPVSEVGG